MNKLALEPRRIEISCHYGYTSAWLARITGTSKKYGFEQEFISALERPRSKSGKTGHNVYILTDPGLYRVGKTKDEDGYYLLSVISRSEFPESKRFQGNSDEFTLNWNAIESDRAMKIALLLDSGASFEEARKITKPKQ